MRKILYAIIFLIAVSTAGLAESKSQKTEPNYPTVKELLENWALTQEKLQSVIIKYESEAEKWVANIKPGRKFKCIKQVPVGLWFFAAAEPIM